MVQTERVIFREYKDPYMPGVPHYLAVFPDDEAAPGKVCSVPFYFAGCKPVFEPYHECTLHFYLSTKIVHKSNPLAEKLLQAVSAYYETPFRMVEKLTNQGRNRNV